MQSNRVNTPTTQRAHPRAMQPATSTPRAVKAVTADTQERLAAYAERNNLSARKLGLEIGYSPAAVSTYLGGKFQGNVDAFEAAAENILRTEPIRKLSDWELFDTEVTMTIDGVIATMLETNDLGLIRGAAGIGKTAGVLRFVSANPTSILITLSEDCCNSHYIRKVLFAAVKSRSFFKSGLNVTEWIYSKLRGSNRPIFIDNAHRMRASARKWIFDFQDATGCPVILVGNPEVLDAIKLNDQQFSRIGLAPEVELDPAQIPAIALRILRQMCIEHADALHAYAVTVASHRGHLRALRKEIKLALNLMKRGERDPKAAFRAAHSQLVRNYDL